MSGKGIQLPFSIVKDKSTDTLIKLNLPPNYRKDQLPNLGHPRNPAIKDVIKDCIVDNLSLHDSLI